MVSNHVNGQPPDHLYEWLTIWKITREFLSKELADVFIFSICSFAEYLRFQKNCNNNIIII